MSVQSEIDRIITAVGNAYSKVSEKGGTVPAYQTVANLTTAIESIPSGITPSGNIQLTKQSGTDVTNYATASVRSGSLSLNTPTINTSTGVVTASASLSTSGWVGSAPSSTTLSLTTQGAKTVTPGTSSQTAVAAGRYTTGAVTVAGDADLVAGNIKSGVNIFGVNGTLQPAKTEQSKTLTLGAAAPSTVTPDSGKVLSSVPVSIDTSVIKAENIAKDVTMLGITGTHEGGGGKGGDYNIVQTIDGDNCSLAITDANTFVLTTKTVTANGTYNASSDNADGYSQVTVTLPVYDGSVV